MKGFLLFLLSVPAFAETPPVLQCTLHYMVAEGESGAREVTPENYCLSVPVEKKEYKDHPHSPVTSTTQSARLILKNEVSAYVSLGFGRVTLSLTDKQNAFARMTVPQSSLTAIPLEGVSLMVRPGVSFKGQKIRDAILRCWIPNSGFAPWRCVPYP
jgi:hypothetical protein